jgi:hypothetical protein
MLFDDVHSLFNRGDTAWPVAGVDVGMQVMQENTGVITSIYGLRTLDSA